MLTQQKSYNDFFSVYKIYRMFFYLLVGNVLRRQSLARLHSLAIEAPITKVINILAALQESSPAHVAQTLDKV